MAAKHGDRFVLGVGTGHRESSQQYQRPYETLAGFVDTLLGAGVPAGRIVLAALGPKVLRLGAERTAGVHPYLVPPEHTRLARAEIGPGPLLAPEQKVVLDADPQRGRALGRETVERYLGLVNYPANLRRLGFTDEDLAGRGSDRLVDAVIARGTVDPGGRPARRAPAGRRGPRPGAGARRRPAGRLPSASPRARAQRASPRLITSRWIWLVPSKICITLASRMKRSTGKARV